jgi:hypothetical protein
MIASGNANQPNLGLLRRERRAARAKPRGPLDSLSEGAGAEAMLAEAARARVVF